MKTDKIYVTNVYIKEAPMELVEVKEDAGLWAAFTATIFFPTGGGQLCDTGWLADYQVTDVKEDKETGLIWHKLEGGSKVLTPGMLYMGKLDWEKRFSHMQMHCGEHLLSGAFLKLFGAANKGFHMGEDYVTIDMDCPEGEITWDMAKEAERLANQWVQMNIPVETYAFDTAEEAMILPCRKEIKFGKDITVVLIGPKQDPMDCCACCGTHPVSTGEIGLIKITHSEKYKNMNRFYVKCGMKAFEDYSQSKDILLGLGKKYSCDPQDLEKTFSAAENRSGEVYKAYSTLKSYYLDLEMEKVKRTFIEPCSKSIRVFTYPQFSADDLQNMARKLEKEIKSPCAFVSEKENSCILASSGQPHCGNLVRENAPIYKGKGGGKPNMARAIFEKKEDLDLYLDLIEKHLR